MEDGDIVLEKIIPSANPNRQELATTLLPALASSLAEALWNKTMLKAVVVGRGPGSFTGIRGAVAIARAVAYALKLPLLGVTRFEVIASYFEDAVGVVFSAYREYCYMSVLELAADKQTKWIIDPACIALSELVPSLSLARQNSAVSCFVADAGIKSTASIIGSAVSPQKLLPFNEEIPFKPLPAVGNLASRQSEIAWNRLSLKSGNPDDVLAYDFPWKLVEPLYLREPSVTLKKG